MQTKQQGFTLIELVVVIVILGILAATALPKFINLQKEANDAATAGIAGGISSAFAINYAGYVANSTKGTQINGTVDVTAAAGSIMVGGIPASGYTVTPSTVNCSSAGQSAALTVSGGSSATATAMLVCTG